MPARFRASITHARYAVPRKRLGQNVLDFVHAEGRPEFSLPKAALIIYLNWPVAEIQSFQAQWTPLAAETWIRATAAQQQFGACALKPDTII
jgi:hypothetical protein